MASTSSPVDGPSYALSIATTSTNSSGNIIEECQVSQIAGGSVSGINVSGAPGDWISAIVKDNFLYLTGAPAGEPSIGINGSLVRNYLVEGNYVEGAGVGFASDVGGVTNVTVSHNTFKGVERGCAATNGPLQNLSFIFNTIELSNDPAGAAAGFQLFPATNVSVVGNTVKFDDDYRPGDVGSAVKAFGVVGLTISENRVDTHLTNFFNSACANITAYGNFDLSGNIFTSLDMPAVASGTNLLTQQITVNGIASLGILFMPSNAQSGAILTSDPQQAPPSGKHPAFPTPTPPRPPISE